MAGVAPTPHPFAGLPTTTVHDHQQIVFVPVDGRVVFFFCLLLIAACAVWLILLCRKGMREGDRE